MAYGMKINDTVGNTVYDTTSKGGVFVEFAQLPTPTDPTTIATIQYTSLVGRNIYVMPLVINGTMFKVYGPADIPVGYTAPLGYPVIQYSRAALASAASMIFFSYTDVVITSTILMVFAI